MQRVLPSRHAQQPGLGVGVAVGVRVLGRVLSHGTPSVAPVNDTPRGYIPRRQDIVGTSRRAGKERSDMEHAMAGAAVDEAARRAYAAASALVG